LFGRVFTQTGATLLENAMVFPIMKTRALQEKTEKKKAGLVRARL